MFTAIRSDGKAISLCEKKWTREELEKDRIHFQYVCPECKERLILRLGYEQTWHFAHYASSSCPYSTGETEEHLQAKLIVVNWLRKQKYDPKVEYYLKEIKQRPDVFVVIGGQSYVFEIQRASISEESYLKRQENYQKLNIETIWIGIYSNLGQLDRYTCTTTKLDHFLLRTTPFLHSIYLSVHNSTWYLLTNFTYLSRQKTMLVPVNMGKDPLVKNLLSLRNVPRQNTVSFFQIFFPKWLKEVRKKRLRMYHQVNQTERILLRMFQKHQLNLNYFPALGSVPLKENFYFLTAPQWWQSWIIMEIINKTEVNQCISLTRIVQS